MIDRLLRATPAPRCGRPRGAAPRWHRRGFETLESRCLLSVTSAVAGRHVFYDNSSFDGNAPGPGASDDAAIATDKEAYLPGSGLMTPSNMTSYSRGLNGIMVDITGSHPDITAADFIFQVGANNAPGSWSAAPAPTSVSVRPGAGVGGSDRVTIIWADNAIENSHLQVIVAANENTGLPQSDVFLFGNLIGDTFVNTPGAVFVTTASDEVEIQSQVVSSADVTSVWDMDRNGVHLASDRIVTRSNTITAVNRADLPAQLPPALAAALAVDTGPDSTPNSDGITSDPTVAGTLTSSAPIASFQAGLNGGPVTTDALAQLAGGNFTLDQAFLETLNGGPLTDGDYVVRLHAVDAGGLGAAAEVAFTLKTSVAAPAIPDLVADDDTGTSSTDDITKINTPRIDVDAETGSLVRIFVDGSPVDTGVGSPGLQFTLAALADGVRNIHVEVQDGAGNSATSPTLPITISTVAPTVSTSTKVTISADLTPHVTVAASGPLGLPNGTQVTLDVDLDYDGNFAGAGEVARTTSTLHNGGSYFQLTPALPHDISGAAYNVQLRTRVTDVAGNEGISAPIQLNIDSIGNSILEDYVAAFDPSYNFTLVSTDIGPGFTTYTIDMTSQTWRSLADVNKPVWQHWVQIYVPDGGIDNTAVLLIDGGSNSASPPGVEAALGLAAVVVGTPVVRLPNVPNQSLIFTGDPGNPRSEDAIIGYTFDQYVNSLGGAGGESWPVLLPMVKSAVRTMDTVQAFIPTVIAGGQIDDFLVTGYSKRGWTTWLTAAVDDRVRAIIPGVIDVLNMGEQLVHHYGAYSDFSFAIDDYTEFEIPQKSYTVGGQELARVVDPYSYLDNGRFDDLPKLLINSSGDEFFLTDSAQFYFDDLPGTQNYLRYIPNTGHAIDVLGPIGSTLTFYDAVVNGTPLPEFSWTVGQDGAINVQTTSTPLAGGVKLWQATNPAGRDFRDTVTGVVWTSTTLSDLGGGTYVGNVATPATGATGYFIELTFDHPDPTSPDFVFTTEARVATDIPLTSWDFFMPTIAPPVPPPPPSPATAQSQAAIGPGRPAAANGQRGLTDAVAVALSVPTAASEADVAAPPAPIEAMVETPPARAARVDAALQSSWSWDVQTEDEPPSDDEDEASVLLLGDEWH